MTGVADARLVRHVGEFPIAVVAVERVPGDDVHFRARHGGAVEKIDVDVAVGVVVEQREAGAHVFDDIVFAAAAVGVTKGDPRLVRDVVQQNRRFVLPTAKSRGNRRQRAEWRAARHLSAPNQPGVLLAAHHFMELSIGGIIRVHLHGLLQGDGSLVATTVYGV